MKSRGQELFLLAMGIGLLLLAGAGPVQGAGKIAFLPPALNFDTVPIGESASVGLRVLNVGDATLLVRGLSLAVGAPFSVRDSAFAMAAGDTVEISVTFSPTEPGERADALVVSNSSAVEEALVSLTGMGPGPNLEVSATRLVFSGPGIGEAATVDLTITNTGSDTLRVSEIATSDTLFVVAEVALTIAPDSTFVLGVAHTPISSVSRIDTLTLVSNDLDTGTMKVLLDVIGTPRLLGSARLNVTRVDTVQVPAIGDTISVELLLKPVDEVVEGVEVFFGFDAAVFQPVSIGSPVTSVGISEGALFLIHRFFKETDTGRGVVHFSILPQSSVTAEGTLARIQLAVVGPIPAQTFLGVLNEEPLLNTNHITLGLEAYTLASENRVTMGNSPPVIKHFPLVATPEDHARSVALKRMATDKESPVEDLNWFFEDQDSLVVISVSTFSEDVGPVARFFPPKNGYGAYRVMGIVADPAGGRDTTIVIMEVEQVNDPPLPPESIVPVDGASGLPSTVGFDWKGDDPDPDETLTYDFMLGTTDSTLSVTAQGLTESKHTLSGLSAQTDYFWQVVSTDAAGLKTPGDVSKFSTAKDETPPKVEVGPMAFEPTSNSVGLTWRTDEPTRDKVRYGPSEGFADSIGVQELVLDNLSTLANVSLTDLDPSTDYAYQVSHSDTAGNTTVSAVKTFTTTAGPGDLTNNGVMDFADFVRFAQAYGLASGDPDFLPDADFGGDGIIGFDDFVSFSQMYIAATSKVAGEENP